MQNWLRESDLMVSFNKSEGLIWTKWFIKLMIGKMRYDVTVSKSQNLDTTSRPCYDGDDYTDQEYLKLGEIIKEKFQCTSPFVPKHLRQGLTICKDQRMGKKVWNFIHSNLAFMNFNMWRSDFYFIPPCTFYEFTSRETWKHPGWTNNILIKFIRFISYFRKQKKRYLTEKQVRDRQPSNETADRM